MTLDYSVLLYFILHFLFLLDITLSHVTLAANSSTYFIGQQLSLQCMAYGYPLATISWAKNNTQVTVSDNIGFGISSMSGYIAQSILYFNPIMRGNDGVYSCNGLDSKGNLVRSNTINIRE